MTALAHISKLNGCRAFALPAWQAKIKVYQGRFSLLYQRLRRNSRFAPLNAVQVCAGRQCCKLTHYVCIAVHCL